MTDFRFPRAEKLKHKREIDLLFAKGKWISCGNLRIISINLEKKPQEDFAVSNQKFGVSVSKRYFKKAVDRNKIKRLLREAYRLNKETFTEVFGSQTIAMIFWVSKEKPANYQSLEEIQETQKQIIEEKTPETPELETAAESVQEKVIVPSEKREWKPMSFAGNTPDALIGKVEIKAKHKTDPSPPEAQKTEPVAEIIVEEKAEERPVFNVSFFTQNVSPIESEKVAEKIEEKIAEPEESNVPTFINTWQNWLKIDRSTTQSEEQSAVSKAEVKNTVIENFIVKEPRISKLKEESDFVVKEKGDNISHLMTETLAKLYVEQKLYSKAIKAYHILSEKHPEKKSHFSDQINYIKELRQNK